jgi:CDP-paratose 2-epimerase
MYGGRQFATYDQGWVGWFCQKAVEIKKGFLKEPFTISGNGKQVRDMLHAEDMVSLYYSAAKRIEKIKGNAFNIGGGLENSLSLLELFTVLEKDLDIKMSYQNLAPRISDQKFFVAETSKIRKSIGWEAKVDFLTGIRQMIEWVS